MSPEVKAAREWLVRASASSHEAADEYGSAPAWAIQASVRREYANSIDTILAELDEAEHRVAVLEAALYPLVTEGVRAEMREDAPEYVNDEVYEGARALPQCVPCGGTGATDQKHYEDQPIPEELLCAVCDGFGFTMHPDAAGSLEGK